MRHIIITIILTLSTSFSINSMEEASFSSLTANLENSIDSVKIDIIKNLASETYTCDQVQKILSKISLGSSRITAFKILSSKIEDPDNKTIIMTAFQNDIGSIKSEAYKILDRIKASSKPMDIESIFSQLKLGEQFGCQFEQPPISLTECYKKYKTIAIGGSDLTQKNIDLLSRLKDLEGLSIGSDIPGLSLKFLNNFPKLKGLDLSYQKGLSNELSVLKNNKQLELLVISGLELDNSSITFLSSLNNLKSLNLSENAISDDSLEYLKNMTNLKELYLSNTKIDGSGFKYLSKLKKLEHISLDGSNYNKVNDKYLSNFPKLTIDSSQPLGESAV